MKLGRMPVFWAHSVEGREGYVPAAEMPVRVLVQEFVGFGIFDKKGREFGAFEWIQVRQLTQGEVAPAGRSQMMCKPEDIGLEVYEVVAQAARAGKAHGSSGSTFFTSLAEAQKQAAAYLRKAKRTAIKKHEAGA